MKRLLSVTVLLAICLSRPAFAQSARRVQPLLGVGEVPATASAAPEDPFFDDTLLQEIRLDINSKDWDTLKENFLSNAYYPADFHWGSQVVRNVGIRSRGTASRSGVKPGLRVDFNRYADAQTFLGLKSFVLRNNATDFSNMHERVSMQLFRRTGSPAPRVAHTRLFVNGAYAGLYSIVESIDKDFLSRRLNDSDGVLYKYDRNVDDPPYRLEYLGADGALYVPHPFKPETHESDPQPQPIADLIRLVAESSEAAFRSSVGAFLDLAAFIKHVATEDFLAETDGFLGDSGMNNFYLYRLARQQMHVIIPWDKSESTKQGSAFSIFHNIDDVPVAMRNQLMARVWKDDALYALYLDALVACANSASETIAGDGRGWMEREVDREYDQIRAAVLSDPAKSYSNDDFTAAVGALRVFTQQRAEFVRSEVDRHRADR